VAQVGLQHVWASKERAYSSEALSPSSRAWALTYIYLKKIFLRDG